jgi:hypothetical protein
MRKDNRFSSIALWTISAILAPQSLYAQGRQEPGKSIGSVSVRGNLIVMTLDQGVLGKASLFDLVHRTLRFTPDGSMYRAENAAWQWDADFGAEMTGSQATLKNFSFPFSGRNWTSFSVGVTGSVTLGEPAAGGRGGGRGAAGGGGRGGLSIDRFAELHQAARTLIGTVPAISVFFKPRMSGTRFLKELEDRVVLTWSLTEPMGNIQDMTWVPNVNRFQAVLRKDGTIEMSYEEVAAKDAIVGVYPVPAKAAETPIATIPGEENALAAPHLAIRNVKLAAVDGLFLKATFELRGPALADGDPGIAGVSYRLCLYAEKPQGDCVQGASANAVWSIQGGGGRGGRGVGAGVRYAATGAGVSPGVRADANTITIQGTLPAGYKAGDSVFLSAAVQTPGGAPGIISRVRPAALKLTGLSSPELDLSSVKKDDGPFAAIYEAFHYLKPPRAMDLTCTVIKALGDKFDMLAYYSDFRIDNPEAGTSSNGPLGGGPAGGAVTGIGAPQRNLANYCSQGRFQWQYIQPVYVGSNQMQEYPPEGIKESSTRNIASYTRQLAERTSNGKAPPYNYAVSQIAHEMGHRWSAFVSAKVGGETIQLGPTHWARGLHAPVAFPYQRPLEASLMGGSVWQDNFDGTFTQLDDDYYVPATGWSYLDLYLMGLISASEVPDFFILRNLAPAGSDAQGRPIVKADRTKVTIQDVIAAEGPRLPDVEHSQKTFNTGMVVVVEHGKNPSKELIERTNGIRLRWMDYWETTTGHRSSMTTNPR